MRSILLFISMAYVSFGFKAMNFDNDWLFYTNPSYHYKVSYPSDWEQSSEGNDKIIYFKSPLLGKYDSLAENLNIVVDDLNSPVDLTTFTEQSKKQMLGMGMKDGDIGIKDTKVAGLDAKEVTYAITEGGMKLKFKSFWLIKASKVYLLTYTASSDQYNLYLNTINKMVASFMFIE